MFISLITFRAIYSPDIVSANMQPKYVTFECCLNVAFISNVQFWNLPYFTFRSKKYRFSLIFEVCYPQTIDRYL